jgi:hypothetical protein
MTENWKALFKNVLWKTIKRAIAYSLLFGFVFFILAVIAVLVAVPAGHSGIRKILDSVLVFLVYVPAGMVCGFMLGVAALDRHIEQIVDAVYQTVRGVVSASLGTVADGAQSISSDQLRRVMSSDTGAKFTAFAKDFGAARKLYAWVVRGPTQLMQQSILREFLPSITGANVSMSVLDDFIKHHLLHVVRLPLQAKLRTVRYVAVGVALGALLLPPFLIRLG